MRGPGLRSGASTRSGRALTSELLTLPVAGATPDALERYVFECEAPDEFRIDRTPNEHIAFGGRGPHFCLGANLARSEITKIFGEVFTRLDNLQLAGDVSRLRSNFINGIKHMPVTFTPGPRVRS